MRSSNTHSISVAKEKQKGLESDTTLRPLRVRSGMRGASLGCRSASAQKINARLSRLVEPVAKVTAHVDTGFGNGLFIRGEGNGLSWERGQLMTCVDGATWVWSAAEAREAFEFKLLLNDQVWCQGNNFKLAAGGQVEISPSF
jgi:hypothetical protein